MILKQEIEFMKNNLPRGWCNRSWILQHCSVSFIKDMYPENRHMKASLKAQIKNDGTLHFAATGKKVFSKEEVDIAFKLANEFSSTWGKIR